MDTMPLERQSTDRSRNACAVDRDAPENHVVLPLLLNGEAQERDFEATSDTPGDDRASEPSGLWEGASIYSVSSVRSASMDIHYLVRPGLRNARDPLVQDTL